MNITRSILKIARLRLMDRFSMRHHLTCSITGDNEFLQVIKENKTHYYPLVWLRDNCRCEKCYHEQSSSRILNWDSFNVDVKTEFVESTEGDDVVIVWEDGHKSKYDYNWLKRRDFTETNQKDYLDNVYKPTKKLWSKTDYFKILSVYQYKDVINNDATFYNWLNNLAVHGVALIKNASTDMADSSKLVEKVAFIRKTHYGEAYYIKNKPGTQNVAYLSSALQLHTDLPYYDYTPGANLLHCIVQTESQGGESLLSDAFYAAEQMRRENKELFDVLSKTIVDWCDVGEEDGVKFNKLHRVPVISVDEKNNIQGVRHSIPQRDSVFLTNLENVKPWYRALRTFVDYVNNNAAMFKLEPGDILAFDNTRLVHGRQGYKDTDKSQRFLVGMFLDWDELYSAMRVVRKEIGLQS